MNSVIKSENYILRKAKELKVITLIELALTIITVAATLIITHVGVLKKFFGDSITMLAGMKPGFFDGFVDKVNNAPYRILILIAICSLVTKLYQSGVIKQLVSSGIKRRTMITGQLISVTSALFVITLILSVVSGIGNVILGGKFALTDGNFGRFVLAIFGMLIVLANAIALYMLIAHLTGAVGAAIALGLAVELGGELAIGSLAAWFKNPKILEYYFGTLQSTVVSMSCPIKQQLIAMVVLTAYTVLFLVLCQTAFTHKDIK